MKATKAAGLKARFAHHLPRPAVATWPTQATLAVGHYIAHTFNTGSRRREDGERFVERLQGQDRPPPRLTTEPQTVIRPWAWLAEALKRDAAAKRQSCNVQRSWPSAMENVTVQTPSIGETEHARPKTTRRCCRWWSPRVAKDAKYKADDTDMGFKPVKLLTRRQACQRRRRPTRKMQRPPKSGMIAPRRPRHLASPRPIIPSPTSAPLAATPLTPTRTSSAVHRRRSFVAERRHLRPAAVHGVGRPDADLRR